MGKIVMKCNTYVKIDKVSYRYGNIVALKDIELDITYGEVFTLLGPNGAGKTTLLNIIAGILKPSEGKVIIKGIDITKIPQKIRRIIGFLPQENPLYNYLTGEENLMFYAGLYGIPRSEARRWCKELLQFLGLEAVAKKKVKTYSGGMKRRLSLATALINDPELLILDEPTTGLDPNARREFWRYIDILRKQRTIILSTHYMEEADVLSDRVAIMDRGKILVVDTPINLKKSLGPYSVIEVEFKLVDPRKIEELIHDLAEGGISCKENICRLLVREPDIIIPQMTHKLYKSGVRVTRISISEPTLEDVFIKLTGRRLEE